MSYECRCRKCRGLDCPDDPYENIFGDDNGDDREYDDDDDNRDGYPPARRTERDRGDWNAGVSDADFV